MAFNKSNVLKKNRNIKQKTDLSQLFKLIYEKKGFFSLILLTLVIQLYITYYVSENYNIEENKENKETNIHPFDTTLLGAIIVSFLLLVIIDFVGMPIWLKFIIFTFFSITSGVILAYLKSNFDPNTIKAAFLGTISIFVSMFAFGVALIASNIQLGYMFGLGLLYAFMFMLMILIVQILLIKSSFFYKILTFVSLMLLSIYIVYTTNSILQRNHNGDFISASLAYYVAIKGTFSDLLIASEFDE
jgi:FtsH-binding integral membrane protein